MKNPIIYTILLVLVLVASCKSNQARVYLVEGTTFRADYDGGRLQGIEYLGTDHYRALIRPAFEPVNKSPWYSFGVQSKKNKTIQITFDYGDYTHRYIPKISTDKKNWNKIDPDKIKINSLTGLTTMTIAVSSRMKYISAQEIISSTDTYRWIDSLISQHPAVDLKVAGKTVLGHDNFALEVEHDSAVNAIVMVARQHPPEIPGGTFSFNYFLEELLSDTEDAITFRSLHNIYAFPLLNPDGTDLGHWRHNANGSDLNRDWSDFSQPETQMVRKYCMDKIDQGKQIIFALDFHTSYSGPYLLILDSLNALQADHIIPEWIHNIESNSDFVVEARRRSQNLPYCYNWFYNTFGCEAVTYEEGDEVDRKIIEMRARRYSQELIKTMINPQLNKEN